MDSQLVFVGGARGLGKSKYASMVTSMEPAVRYMNLEQLLQYLAEHTFGKSIAALSSDELNEVGASCVRKAMTPGCITLIDGSYGRYQGTASLPGPFIPLALEPAIKLFILVDCTVDMAIWLRQRRSFPSELVGPAQVESELANEREKAAQTAQRQNKRLIVLKRERNVDFARVLCNVLRSEVLPSGGAGE
ncbi:MAG: hypothetical protein V1708_04485 [Candidatus Micrarchaeota archaeon]